MLICTVLDVWFCSICFTICCFYIMKKAKCTISPACELSPTSSFHFLSKILERVVTNNFSPNLTVFTSSLVFWIQKGWNNTDSSLKLGGWAEHMLQHQKGVGTSFSCFPERKEGSGHLILSVCTSWLHIAAMQGVFRVIVLYSGSGVHCYWWENWPHFLLPKSVFFCSPDIGFSSKNVPVSTTATLENCRQLHLALHGAYYLQCCLLVLLHAA